MLQCETCDNPATSLAKALLAVDTNIEMWVVINYQLARFVTCKWPIEIHARDLENSTSTNAHQYDQIFTNLATVASVYWGF